MNLKTITNEDIPLLESWLYKEYIKQWYNDPNKWLDEVKNRNGESWFIHHFIVMQKEIPIGFCQYYTCIDAQEEWYADTLLPGTYSIDYLIGEEEFLGKGIGKAIVEILVEKIFSMKGTKKIVVQPEEENLPSCRALIANGFQFDKKNCYYYLLNEKL